MEALNYRQVIIIFYFKKIIIIIIIKYIYIAQGRTMLQMRWVDSYAVKLKQPSRYILHCVAFAVSQRSPTNLFSEPQ